MENGIIKKARVLITVKAYPTPSRSHEETVCTAGLLNGERWIRIYPVPYRFLAIERRYPKWGWIELDLERRSDKDFRPESHRPLRGINEDIKNLGTIPSSQQGWEERRRLLLRDVFTDMASLIEAAYGPKMISLGVVKPTRILSAQAMVDDRDWNQDAEARRITRDLFTPEEGGIDHSIEPVRKVPFTFSYRFTTEDRKERTMMVEDWEIGALYWNCLRKHKAPEMARDKVLDKLKDLAEKKELYFIVGTTFQYHLKKAPNPFVIIGLFYPPHQKQFSLFS
jgi:hypothetical protein